MPHNSLRLGIDVYSLRSQGWTAFEILNYCHELGARVVHFSEPRLMGGLDPSHLRAVKSRADELGLDIEIGMLCICPSSNLFNASAGPPDVQLSGMISAAQILNSPIVRAVLGNAADRRGPVPLEQHIGNTVRVLREVRSRAIDAGVKIAIENHSGDMQAWELRTLIEEAGRDICGACIDSGNPLITMESPHVALEILAPYVLTSHIRDTRVWLTDEGAAAAWVAMGEGNVEISQFVRNYIAMCPGRAISLELILSPQMRPLPFRDPSFWEAYRKTPDAQFVKFLALAEPGTPPSFPPALTGNELAEYERNKVRSSFAALQEMCISSEEGEDE